jgi:hypothetical protein
MMSAKEALVTIVDAFWIANRRAELGLSPQD